MIGHGYAHILSRRSEARIWRLSGHNTGGNGPPQADHRNIVGLSMGLGCVCQRRSRNPIAQQTLHARKPQKPGFVLGLDHPVRQQKKPVTIAQRYISLLINRRGAHPQRQ
jgi:hypothetical protein